VSDTWIQENNPVEYKPRPIPTAGLSLTSDILGLTELLARNAHEIWAPQRLAEGWTSGVRRDDAAKKHPCLGPYENLPESEKEESSHQPAHPRHFTGGVFFV
jgi:hypothetical protein